MPLPTRFASVVLRALACVVDVAPRRDSAHLQLATCRFLLGLSMLDVSGIISPHVMQPLICSQREIVPPSTSLRCVTQVFGWLAYKIVQFEAVLQVTAAASMFRSGHLQEPLVTSPVLFVTVLTTLETTIEIGTSALVPTAIAFLERTREPSPGTLALFVCKVYTASALCALLLALGLSPCILGGATDASGQTFGDCEATTCACTGSACAVSWVASNGTSPACCLLNGTKVQMCATSGESACAMAPDRLAIVFAAAYCVLYCFLNQLGDASREMAQTQWLAAFEGTDLVLPGFASSFHGNIASALSLRRPASATALSTHLLILRFLVSGMGGVIYIGLRTRPAARLALLLAAAATGALTGLGMLCGGRGNGSGDGSGGDVLSMSTILRRHWPGVDEDTLSGRDGAANPTGLPSVEATEPITQQPFQADHRVQRLPTSPAARGGISPNPDQAGITDELVLWPSQMHGWEVSLSLFIVASRGLPTTNSDTVLAYFSSSSTISRSLAVSERHRGLPLFLPPRLRSFVHSNAALPFHRSRMLSRWQSMAVASR